MGSHTPAIRRIGIVGAGPVGVSFAKFLIAEKAFDKVDIWEQRGGVGGIWNLSKPTRSKKIPIPQTNPRYGQKLADKSDLHGSQADSLEFESPLYDYLETNIPKALMAYSEQPFAKEDPLFPSHGRVLEYLEEYSADVKHLVRFGTQVEKLQRSQDVWLVKVRHLESGHTAVHEYDAVVVANGHYTIPSVPAIHGLQRWNESYPGASIHSKAYRRPQDYTGQKVLIIGNSASGLDIAYQVAQWADQPVILSARSASIFGSGTTPEWRRDIDEVVEVLPASTHDRAVRCRSGHVEERIDTVIFCTGFFYSFPFLSELERPIVTDGLRTRDVYRDLFHIEHPTLAFPVINLKVVPFPLAENQAAVVARVWSGRLDLPPKETMRQWESDTVRSNGDGKYFHLKKYPEDCAQINLLYDWAKSATKTEGLQDGGLGRLGARWNREMVWWVDVNFEAMKPLLTCFFRLRSQFPAVKAAYASRGESRVDVKTVEELGFDFVKWRETANREDEEMFEKALC